MKSWVPVVACVLLVLLDIRLMVENGRAVGSPDSNSTVLYVSYLVPSLLSVTFVASGCSLLLGLVLLYTRKPIGLAYLAGGLLFGFSAVWEGVKPEFGYKDLGNSVAKDERDYHLLEQSVMQGFDVRICRKTPPSLLGSWYQTVADSPGSYYSKYLKSSPVHATPDAFASTTDGVLLGLTGDDTIFVAFDPKRGLGYGQDDVEIKKQGINEAPLLNLVGKKTMGSDATLYASGGDGY